MKINLALIALVAGGGTIASTSSAGVATPPEQAFRSETKKFRDWTAICDNINNCVAYAPAEGDTGYVMVKMEAGPEAKPLVHADSYALPNDGWRMQLTIDGRSFVGEGVQEGDKRTVTTFPQSSDTLIAAIGNSTTMTLSSADKTTPVTVSGAAAALLWIDERQGRTGTTTALIGNGDRPASAVPTPPSAPTVVRVPAISQENLPRTMPASVLANEHLKQCNDLNREAITANQNWTVYRLGTETLLWSIPCGFGAYNAMESYFTSSPDGSNVQSLSLPSSRGPQEILVNSEFDSQTNTLSAFSKSRGPGDCGQIAKWVWNGNSFAIVQENTMEDCLGMHSDLWPSTWRARS
ncbi:DUF1176 domain-containing protein [Brevundimonas sp. BH3]|uniref:DUF1176 domain-containing protein n=1 Tax=Brevundimonas sp. BH3 TaxID=3133089 RepID=UPI003254B92C